MNAPTTEIVQEVNRVRVRGNRAESYSLTVEVAETDVSLGAARTRGFAWVVYRAEHGGRVNFDKLVPGKGDPAVLRELAEGVLDQVGRENFSV